MGGTVRVLRRIVGGEVGSGETQWAPARCCYRKTSGSSRVVCRRGVVLLPLGRIFRGRHLRGMQTHFKLGIVRVEMRSTAI